MVSLCVELSLGYAVSKKQITIPEVVVGVVAIINRVGVGDTSALTLSVNCRAKKRHTIAHTHIRAKYI